MAAPALPALPPLPANADVVDLLQAEQPRDVLVSRMLRMWGARAPCGELAPTGLQCRDAHGDLDALRTLDRPVVLTLDLGAGQTRYVLLRGLSASFATIEAARGTLGIPNEVLKTLWTGDYVVVAPTDDRGRDRAPRLSAR